MCTTEFWTYTECGCAYSHEVPCPPSKLEVKSVTVKDLNAERDDDAPSCSKPSHPREIVHKTFLESICDECVLKELFPYRDRSQDSLPTSNLGSSSSSSPANGTESPSSSFGSADLASSSWRLNIGSATKTTTANSSQVTTPSSIPSHGVETCLHELWTYTECGCEYERKVYCPTTVSSEPLPPSTSSPKPDSQDNVLDGSEEYEDDGPVGEDAQDRPCDNVHVLQKQFLEPICHGCLMDELFGEGGWDEEESGFVRARNHSSSRLRGGGGGLKERVKEVWWI